MATFVVLKTSLSATTASFFAALSTASSLRLAVVAHLGAGPPGCTRRPARHLIPAQVRKRHEGQDDILKPALPTPFGACGVSRFEPNSIHAARKRLARSKIRSSPVYAGHTIKPLKNQEFVAGACSLGQDRGRRSNRRPLPDSTETKDPLPFERA